MRSALAVVAGFVVMAAIVMITTVLAFRLVLHQPLAAMRAAGSGPPSNKYLATNLAGSALAALIGGYTAAAIAGHAALAHGTGLAAVMLVMSAISMRQAGRTQPRWYQWVLLTVMPVLAIAGAGLRDLGSVSP
jgi:hypothetical protein